MYLRRVPPRDHHYRSRDHAFRVSFSAPLDKNPPRLSREGYIRALEVYGREDVLFGCLKSSVSRFDEWRKQNPGDLDLYRRHANSLGYDWERGSVTEEGIYTSYVCVTATGGPPTYDPSNLPSPEDSPVLPRDIAQFIHTDGIGETAGEEVMTRELEGRFAATNRQQTSIPSRPLRIRPADFQTPARFSKTPVVVKDIPMILRGAPGNLRFVPGEDQKNALGAASLFHVILAMLRSMVDDPEGIAAEDMADIKAMLNYVGEEDSERFVKGFQADFAPQGQRRFAMFPQNATLY